MEKLSKSYWHLHNMELQ